MKKCKDCGVKKPQQEFYGIQNECKKCTQIRVSKNYKKNKKHYQEYETVRNKRPSRIKQRLESQKKQRQKNPHKYLARLKVWRAVKKGLIKKENCIKCGSINVEAHHPDHFKPLEIVHVWVCKTHHREIENQK